MIVLQPLDRDFTITPNEVLRDPALSMDSKAVMTWLLSLPRDWTVRVEQLRKHWRCGLERMKRIMRELIAAGWVRRRPQRKRADGSYAGGDYVVFNTRQPVQAGLALDPVDGDGDADAIEPAPARRRAKAARPESASPESASPESASPESGGPESHLRTPNQERIPPTTEESPPNPPETGGTTSPSKAFEEERGGTVRPDPGPGATGLGRRAARLAAAAALDPATEARFRALVAAYPEGTLRSREADARAAFAALPPAEQAAAVMRARSYAESLRRKPGHAFALQTWLRQGRAAFQELAGRLVAATSPGPMPAPAASQPPADPPPPVPHVPHVPPPAGRPPADTSSESWAMAARGDWPRGGTVFVAADSPQGAAWTAHFARFGRRPCWVRIAGKGYGWPMPDLWPPAAEAA